MRNDMKIIITEDKRNEMSELCEKMLHYGGKLMSCIESIEEDEGYGERMGMHDEWEDGPMGMRRGRSIRTGRYTRY